VAIAPGAEAPRSSAEGATRVDSRRCEDLGAKGTKGVECGEGVSPSPPGKALWRGLYPSQKFFSIFELKRPVLVHPGCFLQLINLN